MAAASGQKQVLSPEKMKSMRTVVGSSPGSLKNKRVSFVFPPPTPVSCSSLNSNSLQVRSVRLKDKVSYTARDDATVPTTLRGIMVDSIACGYFQKFTVVNLSHENMSVSFRQVGTAEPHAEARQLISHSLDS